MNAIDRLVVFVCDGPTCGGRRDSAAVTQRLRDEVGRRGLDHVTIERETCFGHCVRGVNLMVCRAEVGQYGAPLVGERGTAFLSGVAPEDVPGIVDRHVVAGVHPDVDADGREEPPDDD